MKTQVMGVVVLCLLIGLPSAYASKAYWTSSETAPSNANSFHLFIDGVNPAFGQNGTENKKLMEITHNGLQFCLSWAQGNEYGKEICRNITVTPSAFNATYDTGFFVVPKTENQSSLMMFLTSRYHDIGVGLCLCNGHFDMGELYNNVSVEYACTDEYYHFKPDGDKYNECWKALS